MNESGREQIVSLFEAIKDAEADAKDADAERMIAQLISQQPDAPYRLVMGIFNAQSQIDHLTNQLNMTQVRTSAPMQQSPSSPTSSAATSSGLSASQAATREKVGSAVDRFIAVRPIPFAVIVGFVGLVSSGPVVGAVTLVGTYFAMLLYGFARRGSYVTWTAARYQCPNCKADYSFVSVDRKSELAAVAPKFYYNEGIKKSATDEYYKVTQVRECACCGHTATKKWTDTKETSNEIGRSLIAWTAENTAGPPWREKD